MNRREAIIALAALGAVPLTGNAQKAVKIARIGYLASDLARGPQAPREAFRQGLRDLGYVEGSNVVIEYRDAKGRLEQFPALAAELVALNVDVIFAAGTRHVLAAQQATRTIPIVFADVADPVGSGFVTSLARPGGNITGLSDLAPDLIGKSLELLKQVAPGTNRVAFLRQGGIRPERAEKDIVQHTEDAARALGLQVQFVDAPTPEDLDKAFADITKARADALVVWKGVMFIAERRRLAELAVRNRLPAIYPMDAFVVDGGLMSYAPNIADNFRRAASYVDKILKGAKPAELPVEQSSKFELVINLKAAKALGLTIPPSLLQRADEVIR